MKHPEHPDSDTLQGKKCSKCGEMMIGGFKDQGFFQNQFVFGCICGHNEVLDVNGNLIRQQDKDVEWYQFLEIFWRYFQL